MNTFVLIVILRFGASAGPGLQGSSTQVQTGFTSEPLCEQALKKIVQDAKSQKDVTVITARCHPQSSE